MSTTDSSNNVIYLSKLLNKCYDASNIGITSQIKIPTLYEGRCIYDGVNRAIYTREKQWEMLGDSISFISRPVLEPSKLVSTKLFSRPDKVKDKHFLGEIRSNIKVLSPVVKTGRSNTYKFNYEIYSDKALTKLVKAVTNQDNLTINIEGLKPSTTYWIKAYYTDSSGNKSEPTIKSFTTASSGIIAPVITIDGISDYFDVGNKPLFKASKFSTLGDLNAKLKGIDWQVSDKPDFSNLIVSVHTKVDSSGNIDYNFHIGKPLKLFKSYYVRARFVAVTVDSHGNRKDEFSDWGVLHFRVNNSILKPVVSGPLGVKENETATYVIKNYDSSANYSVTAEKGKIELNKDKFTYTAPNIETGTKNITDVITITSDKKDIGTSPAVKLFITIFYVPIVEDSALINTDFNTNAYWSRKINGGS